MPRWHTPSMSPLTDGPLVSMYAQSLLHVRKGPMAGSPLAFAAWQRWLVDQIMERSLTTRRRRYRRGLVGLARKNGKSLIGSAIALHALTEATDSAEVYAAAGDRQQARIVFDEARWQVQNSPALSPMVKVYRDAMEVTKTGSVFRVLSADAKLQQGLNPSLVIFDEVHVQPDDDLWDAMTQGSGARVDPLVLGITTAGHDLDTLLGRMYEYGVEVCKGEEDDDAFGMWWWEPRNKKAPHTDIDSWRDANPNLDEGLLDIDDLIAASRLTGTTVFSFNRFRRNQWTKSEESWLPVGAWDDCEGVPDFDPDLPVYVAIDMAHKHDCVAVLAAQVQLPDPGAIIGDEVDETTGLRVGDTRKVHVQARIWKPGGAPIDVAAVENHLRALHRTLDVAEFTYDPAYFVRSAQALEDEGLPMMEFPQSASRMVPACQTGYSVICTGRAVHSGNELLTSHIESAAIRQTDDGWRLSKGKSKKHIDGAIAFVIATHRALTETPPPAPATAPTGAAPKKGDLFRPTGRLKL